MAGLLYQYIQPPSSTRSSCLAVRASSSGWPQAYQTGCYSAAFVHCKKQQAAVLARCSAHPRDPVPNRIPNSGYYLTQLLEQKEKLELSRATS